MMIKHKILCRIMGSWLTYSLAVSMIKKDSIGIIISFAFLCFWIREEHVKSFLDDDNNDKDYDSKWTERLKNSISNRRKKK